MALYAVTRTSSALNTTNDTVTIVAGAKALRILYVEASGMGTASAANEILIMKSTGGTTGGGAITPSPLAGSGSSTFAVYTTWSATADTWNCLSPPVGERQWRQGSFQSCSWT